MDKELNWHHLHCGPIAQSEIRATVNDPHWQIVRVGLKGASLEERFTTLESYLYENKNSREAQVRVTNYINALARGGMIPPVKPNPIERRS